MYILHCTGSPTRLVKMVLSAGCVHLKSDWLTHVNN